MSKNIFVVTAIATGFLIAFAGSASAQSYPSTIQFSDMHVFDPDPANDAIPLPGAGSLARTRNAVDLRLNLQGLDENAAYTIWWVIFNDPEQCAALPCGLGDLDTPAVHASILWATGFVTGADGVANVGANLRARFIPEGVFVNFGRGLRLGNGFDAEIHAIVKTHGPALADSTADQISLPGGPDVCNPTCVDQQAIMFLTN